MRHTVMIPVLSVVATLAISAPPVAAQNAAQQRAYLAMMRSDLRNLVVAMEMHFSDNQDYARSMPKLDIYTPSQGVTVVMLTSTRSGWSGIAIHQDAPGFVCGIYVGVGPHPLHHDVSDGEVTCTNPDGERIESI